MIGLPTGAVITTEVKESEENELLRNVDILVECEPFLRHMGKRQVQGHVNLRCEDQDVVFLRSSVELSILQDPPGLVQKFFGLPSLVKAFVAASVLLTCVIAAALGWYYRVQIRKWKNHLISRMKDALIRTRLVRLYRGRPVGHLVLYTEVPGASQKTFDLADISRRCNNVILSIGRDASNSLCISHSSLYPFHCLIYASRKRNPTGIYIESRNDGHVGVNGETIKGSRQLRNRDRIDIGNLRFEFIDIQSQRQVRVHMNNGERHIGVLEYWDLGGMLFYMTKVLEKKEEFLTIDFRNVAYIEFYRDESDPEKNILPRPLRKSGKKRRKNITVFLSNNTELHGIVDRKYRYRKGNGILLLPRKKEKIQYMFAPWTSIESVDFTSAEENEEASC
jgi:small nuclear ribonucleoprotein (snRNP)-like protein